MAIKRKDFQKTSSTILEFLLKLPDEETSARLRDTLLHALHFLQQYYLILQKRDKEQKPLQWTIERGLSPLTPFREAPDKFEWTWIDVESHKVKQTIPKHSLNNFVTLSPIIVAVREGDLRYVKELLKSEPDLIHCVDSFGRDLLTYAVQYQQSNVLSYLLNEHKSSINVNTQANDGSTCLHRACYTDEGQQCNIEIVRILLENDADFTRQDVHLRSPLHWSVLAENVDCLQLLVESGANIHIQDIDGMTPAMWACHLDRYEHFKELFCHMNDFTEQDNDGRTWIHHSIRKTEPLQCLKHLLSAESILLRDNDGKTCLHVAAEQGSVHACRLIFEISEQTNAGSYIHDGDSHHQTPLHLATKHGHARVLKELLDHGADPHLKDIQGTSALDYAQNRGFYFCRSVFEVYLRDKHNITNGNSRPSTNHSMSHNVAIKTISCDVAPVALVNRHTIYTRRNGFRSNNELSQTGNISSSSLSTEPLSRLTNCPTSSLTLSSRQDDDPDDDEDFAPQKCQPSSSTTTPSMAGPPVKPRRSTTASTSTAANESTPRTGRHPIVITVAHSEDDNEDSEANSLQGHKSDEGWDDDQSTRYERPTSRLSVRSQDDRHQWQSNNTGQNLYYGQLNKSSIYDVNRCLDERQQQLTSPNKTKRKNRSIINNDHTQSTFHRLGSSSGNHSASNKLQSGSKSSSTESIPTLDLTVAGQKLFRSKKQPEIYFANSLVASNVVRPPSGRLKPISSVKSSTCPTDVFSSTSMKTLEDVTNNAKHPPSSVTSITKMRLYKKKLSPLPNGSDPNNKKYFYRPLTDQQHGVVSVHLDRPQETHATARHNEINRDLRTSNYSEGHLES